MSRPERRTLVVGRAEVPYELHFGERKRLSIEVFPDLRVVVRAPTNARLIAVEAALRQKRQWIRRQQRYFRTFLPRTPERRYVSGETHLYLGRQYRLKVNLGHEEGRVRIVGGELWIAARTASGRRWKPLLDSWYRARAHAVFPKRLEEWLRHPEFRRIETVPLSIRPMSRRWGSCSRRGRITLNVALIRASRASIDYVIVHELCHLLVPNHSPKFDRLLSRVLPDWRARKEALEMRLR